MFVARTPRQPVLAGLVKSAWYFEGSFAHRFERVLASGEPQLLINLAEDELRWYSDASADAVHTLSGTIVSGPYARPFFIDTIDQRSIIGIEFEAGAAGAVLGLPLDQLRDLHVDLRSLWGAAADELRDRALGAGGRVAALDAVLETLARRRMGTVSRTVAPPETMRHIADELAAGRRVGELADRLGWTHRRLLATVSSGVGMRPKLYARLGRFQRALRLAACPEAGSWAEVAAQAGYYDQAHLHRDFRAFYGKPPGSYRPRAAGDVNHVVASENLLRDDPASRCPPEPR